MRRNWWMLMLAGSLTSIGCEQKPADRSPGKVTSEDVRRDAGQAVNTAAEFSQQTKEEFQKKLAARLKELDAEIAKLREKGRDLADQAKANWDRKLAELETKRDAGRARLAEVSNSSAEAWKDIHKGTQSAWDELDKAVLDASREF
jgi:TolA-binding protein